MPGDKRHHRRFNRRMQVRFGLERPEHIGFLRNLCLSGIALASNHLYPPGSRLTIALDAPGGPIELAGGVLWAVKVPHHFQRALMPSSMGIRLIRPPRAWRDLLRDIACQAGDKRRRSRTPAAGATLACHLRSERRPVLDLSPGGAFVQDNDPPPVGAALAFDLSSPALTAPIRGIGRVTHVVALEEAGRDGVSAGFGLRFERIDDGAGALDTLCRSDSG